MHPGGAETRTQSGAERVHAMRSLILVFALLASLGSVASAQRLFVESDTVEGQLLQQIDAEKDEAKRVALLEKFANDFPNHEAVTWVLSNLQSAALQSKEYDKVLEIATRILALDPDDVAAAHNALRAVEAKKDPELVRRWSSQTSTIAKRVIATPARDDEEAEDHKAKVEFAQQVDIYTEYSLYAAALSSTDEKVKTGLIETLETRNPKSEYLAQMRTSQAAVVRQVDAEEAVRFGEESFAKGNYNIDQMFMVASYHMQRRSNPDKVVLFGLKLLEVVETTPKPAGISDDDWQAHIHDIAGQTNWMVGLIFSTQEKYALADKHLRAALNDIKNQDMVAGALYHLGYVNYKIAESGDRIRIHDAVKFTADCAKIQSAVQAQAAENLKSMKAEYALPDDLMPRD
jgi:tetratricopeptide (TPR) repeat protein